MPKIFACCPEPPFVEHSDIQCLVILENALAVPKPLLKLPEIQLALVNLQPFILLVILEVPLKKLPCEIMQYSIPLFIPVYNAPEIYAVLVLLQSDGYFLLALDLLSFSVLADQDWTIKSVEACKLFRLPLSHRLLTGDISQIDLPLHVVLHFEFHCFESVEDRQLVHLSL